MKGKQQLPHLDFVDIATISHGCKQTLSDTSRYTR